MAAEPLQKALSRFSSRYFTLNARSGYTSFIPQTVLNDDQHPMYLTRKRLESQRQKTGLWWHATVGFESSKARVVRIWVRRRLHNAFLEELKERCIAEDGTIEQSSDKLKQFKTIQRIMKKGGTVSLEGSLKLHAQAPIVSAKYADVRADTSRLIDAILLKTEHSLKEAFEGNQVLANLSRTPSQMSSFHIRRQLTTQSNHHTKRTAAKTQ